MYICINSLFIFQYTVRKAVKKVYFFNCSAIKEGWGVKGHFWNSFYILLPFTNKKYFTLDNLSIYGHIRLKFVGRYFTGFFFLQYLSKNTALLVRKVRGEKN